MTSCIYAGHVRHRRRAPRAHGFRYRMLLFYLDLDELAEVDRTVRPFSVNRFNLVSFHDRDHLDGSPGDLRPRVAAVLRDAGVSLDAPKVYLLTQCRVLGYAFNPLSLYYCHDGPGGPLRAVVAEVNNTLGERHLYVLRNRLDAASDPASDPPRRAARYRAAKAMYVSPFLAPEGHYDFHLAPVGPRLRVGILQHERGRPTLDARLRGRRVALTSRSVARLLATHPLAGVQTIAAIHFEALRLWLKRIPVHRWVPRGSGLALRATVDDAAETPAAPAPAAHRSSPAAPRGARALMAAIATSRSPRRSAAQARGSDSDHPAAGSRRAAAARAAAGRAGPGNPDCQGQQ